MAANSNIAEVALSSMKLDAANNRISTSVSVYISAFADVTEQEAITAARNCIADHVTNHCGEILHIIAPYGAINTTNISTNRISYRVTAHINLTPESFIVYKLHA
jgi:hypothetical protein